MMFSSSMSNIRLRLCLVLIFLVKKSSNQWYSFLFSVTTQPGTASANVDYDPKTEVVTFKPADVFKTVEFTIRDDNKIEEKESFKVVLNTISAKVKLGSVVEHTIEIEDDDCKYITAFEKNVFQRCI